MYCINALVFVYGTRTRSYVLVTYSSAVLCLRYIPLRDIFSLKGSLFFKESTHRKYLRAWLSYTRFPFFFLHDTLCCYFVFTFDIFAYKNFPFSGRFTVDRDLSPMCLYVCFCVSILVVCSFVRVCLRAYLFFCVYLTATMRGLPACGGGLISVCFCTRNFSYTNRTWICT